MAILLTLPPHLLESILALLESDVGLPRTLREQLRKATEVPEQDNHEGKEGAEARTGGEEVDGTEGNGGVEETDGDPGINESCLKRKDVESDEVEGCQLEKEQKGEPQTIDVEVLEKVSRWSMVESNRTQLRSRGLDPSDYILISLLSGTEVYYPPKQRAFLLSTLSSDQPNPYLPSYLSPRAPSLIQEYRSTAKQLTTTFNILFSIVGSAAAVYIASVTGAGYMRETAVILAVLTGLVVGIAEGVLYWIWRGRLEQGRAEARLTLIEQSKGSGAVEEYAEGTEAEGMGAIAEITEGPGERDVSLEKVVPTKLSVRLRRRGVKDTADT
ncbi:hypothetical protein P7C73_g2198, partial [Tremellales sp. Uapishka_1]